MNRATAAFLAMANAQTHRTDDKCECEEIGYDPDDPRDLCCAECVGCCEHDPCCVHVGRSAGNDEEE